MQAEIERLKEENKELRKKNDISKQIIRHKESYTKTIAKKNAAAIVANSKSKGKSYWEM